MRLAVFAISRLGACPESTILDGYFKKINAFAPQSRIGPAQLRELDAKGAGQEVESKLLLAAAEKSEVVVALDERGKSLSSRSFAERLGSWRDEGVREVAFLLGGADGHCDKVREAARLTLSLSAMTWPHALARAMLAEQLFRASSILASHPYHRE